MDPLPRVVPISELRIRQNELLEEASEEPIVLTQHGRAAAVLLGPEPYDRLLKELEDLRLALNAVEARTEEAPVTDLEEYLEERGENGSAATDE